MNMKLPGPLIQTPRCALFGQFLNSLSLYRAASLPASHPSVRSRDYGALHIDWVSDLCRGYRNTAMEQERQEKGEGEGARAASGRGAQGPGLASGHILHKRVPGAQEGEPLAGGGSAPKTRLRPPSGPRDPRCTARHWLGRRGSCTLLRSVRAQRRRTGSREPARPFLSAPREPRLCAKPSVLGPASPVRGSSPTLRRRTWLFIARHCLALLKSDPYDGALGRTRPLLRKQKLEPTAEPPTGRQDGTGEGRGLPTVGVE